MEKTIGSQRPQRTVALEDQEKEEEKEAEEKETKN